MKYLVFIIATVSQPLLAATFSTTATVDVHDLSCVIPAGRNNAEYTQLKNDSGYLVFGLANGQNLHLPHKFATASGCDMDELNKISHGAYETFGFLFNVPITVAQKITHFNDGKGHCFQDEIESVAIQLNRKIRVTSESNKISSSTGCSD